MYEKLTRVRTWGGPSGEYQAPGAALAEAQEEPDEVYKLLLEDIDRLLAVIPVKTALQKELDQ